MPQSDQNPSFDGMLMPTIGTFMALSFLASSGSMLKELTTTASALRSTGRSVKNFLRSSAEVIENTEMS